MENGTNEKNVPSFCVEGKTVGELIEWLRGLPEYSAVGIAIAPWGDLITAEEI